jgi:MFS family permease
MSTSYPLALILLFVAGFFDLAFFAMAQTLVQLRARPENRGQVIGLFVMAALGLRAFGGVTVGLGGSIVGIHWSLALSAVLLFVVVAAIGAFSRRRPAAQY